jgi:flagellar basal-body rod protein FlgC
MRLDNIFDVNGSAMKAQMMRIEVLSSNIANVNVTRTPEGGPYRRKDVIFESTPFLNTLNQAMEAGGETSTVGVSVTKVIEDQSPFLLKYDPKHPDAGSDGYVRMPNINIVSEMVNIQEASKSYEANISVIMTAKNMISKTFEIGR